MFREPTISGFSHYQSANTPIHRCTFPLVYFINFGMPSSHLFEVTIDTAGASTSRRVSKLSRRYRRQRRESSGVMESRPPVAAGPGPGRARGLSKKSLPPPRDSPPRGAKSIAFKRIHAAVRPSLSHPCSAEAAAHTPSHLEAAAHTPSRDEAASRTPSDAALRTPNFAEAAVTTLDGTDDEDLISDDSSDDNEILGYKGGGDYPAPVTRSQ